ncbi:hypothetical protein G3M53_02225, partial [Streptomyces sp. SID7982]|nr:hypothetical protein [Streptomyces sp. SID7982]
MQRLWPLVEQDEDLLGTVEAIVEAGLVTWFPGEGRVAVSPDAHVGIIATMTPSEADFAHRWAARWSDGVTSLLHRAAAVHGSDDHLAFQLEFEARQFGAQGRCRKAAELLRRAADISAGTALAAQRESLSAEFALRAHDLHQARRSLSAVREGVAPAFHRALAGRLAVLENRIDEGASLLQGACRELRQAGETDGRSFSAAVQWSAHAQWLAGDPVRKVGQQLKELDSLSIRDPYWASERQRLEAILTSSAEGPAQGLRVLADHSTAVHSASAEVRGRSAVTEAWLRLEAGDADRCEAAARSALAVASSEETGHIVEAAMTIRGHALWLRGAWEEAKVCGTFAAASSSPLRRSRGETL